MLVQGSNNPLVIKFDQDVSAIPTLLITLWCDSNPRYSDAPIKTWETDDMTISGDTVTVGLDEDETAAIPAVRLVLEAKGLDSNGKTLFWSAYPIDVLNRHDKVITLTEE